MKHIVKLTEKELKRMISESVKRVLKENVDIDPDELCYGRDDLMEVAESIANELGDIDIAEDLCNEMATAAVKFVKHLLNGGTFSFTRY